MFCDVLDSIMINSVLYLWMWRSWNQWSVISQQSSTKSVSQGGISRRILKELSNYNGDNN